MMHILNEEYKDDSVEEAISKCKSNSGIIGTELRTAHSFLGSKLYEYYKLKIKKDSVVVAFMRAGYPFASGIADSLDSPFLLYDDKHDVDFFTRNKELFVEKDILFVDAVINSGNSILKAIEKSGLDKKKIKIISNVLSDKNIEKFSDFELFTVRVSKNSFVGTKVTSQKDGIGPDTGDRLFKTL